MCFRFPMTILSSPIIHKQLCVQWMMCITTMPCMKGGEMVLSAGFSRSNLEENGKERKWKNWEGRKCGQQPASWMDWIWARNTTKRKIKIFPPQATWILRNHQFSNSQRCQTYYSWKCCCNTNFQWETQMWPTGHKLQGMSKNALIVNSWEYRFEDWVDVILLRVYTHPKRTLPCSASRFGERFQCTSETPWLWSKNEGCRRSNPF